MKRALTKPRAHSEPVEATAPLLAAGPPRSPTTQSVMALQRLAGNRATTALLQRTQSTPSQGVIQRCATDATCANADPCPLHYSQAGDPSVRPFLRAGESFMGQTAMNRQRAGQTPSADEVRVRAVNGSGLDEGDPTSERAAVAAATVAGGVDAGIQSGLRGATDLALLMSPGGATGHTGFFRVPGANGSTNATGQAAAHDIRRGPIAAATPSGAVAEMTTRYVASLASGPAAMQSNLITGGIPHALGGGAAVEPVLAPLPPGGQPVPTPVRLEVARGAHERREHMKGRLETYTTTRGLPYNGSPEREPLDATGGGGGYVQAGGARRARSPLPQFDGADDVERAANESAWLSASERHDFDPTNKPKQCVCGAWNPLARTRCRTCGHDI